MAVTVGLVSLGCDKNRINAEQMLWKLMAAGYEIVEIPEMAQVVLINTCSFIESAKAEAIENILEIVAAKRENRIDGIGGDVEKILVTGCLSQRYGEEILKEIPEVNGLVGCGSFGDIVPAVEKVLRGETVMFFGDIDEELEEIPRFMTGPGHYAYIKIAEGCDHSCSYCVIPSLRGRYRSRTIEHIMAEAEDLCANGVRELILVAQDVTRYGVDLYGRKALPELLEALCTVEGLEWIRLHYLYPEEITDELIQTIRNQPKILKYMDIPIQHIDDGILERMNRRSRGDEIRALLSKIRRALEGVVLRTSIIVGFPGEGETEFTALCDFLREAKIERTGFFAFSPEEGTPAAEMEDLPSEDLVRKRLSVARDIQDGILSEYNCRMVGKIMDVICDGYDAIIQRYFGRTYADSPDVDGKVFFSSKKRLNAGDITPVLIQEELDGDLFGKGMY